MRSQPAVVLLAFVVAAAAAAPTWLFGLLCCVGLEGEKEVRKGKGRMRWRWMEMESVGGEVVEEEESTSPKRLPHAMRERVVA